MIARSCCAAALMIALLHVSACAGPRPWAALQGGASTYGMSDLNAEIASLNELLGPGGLHMDEIHGAFGYGASAGIDLDSGLGLGVGWERLPGHTEVADPTGRLEYDVPANLFRVFVEYAVMGEQGMGTLVGFSAGRVIEAGSIRSEVTGVGAVESELEGAGPAFEFYVGGQYRSGPVLSFTGAAGYRHARASGIEVEGRPVYNASGEEYSIDYTGLFARLALKIGLARPRN